MILWQLCWPIFTPACPGSANLACADLSDLRLGREGRGWEIAEQGGVIQCYNMLLSLIIPPLQIYHCWPQLWTRNKGSNAGGESEGKYVVSHISLFCSIKRILVFTHTLIEQTKPTLFTKNFMVSIFQKHWKQFVSLGDVCERICKKQCSEVVIEDSR